MSEQVHQSVHKKYVYTMCKKCAVARNVGPVVPLLGIMLELLLGRCPAARYVRLPGNMPGMSGSPASALRLRLDAQRQPSAAPLATSTDRHERRHATTPKDRAQLRGRASGVRCKAMLGGLR